MGDTNNTTTDDNPGDLRNQRDKLADENKKLAERVAAFEQREQLREYGLGHLSARQQRSVLRELAEEGKDLSKEIALEIAEDLGFKTAPDPTPNTDGNGTTPPATTSTTDDQGGNNDPPNDSEDALTAMDLMDRARGSGDLVRRDTRPAVWAIAVMSSSA